MSETMGYSDPDEGYKKVRLGPKTVRIPSEWEVRKLDELTKNTGSYGANASAVEYDPEKPRYIRITDIGEDGFLKDEDRKSIPHDDAEGYYLSEGDLLFARTGATAGKSYLYRENGEDAAYAGYLIQFEIDKSQVDPEFLAFFVQSKLYDDWVDRTTRHGAQQNINASEYRNLDVLYPSLPEQRRIADILSTVDEQIQQTDEIINHTLELRQGVVQDLFSRGFESQQTKSTPIGEVPDSWELVRGKKILDLRNGKHVSSDERCQRGEYPVYGGNGVLSYYDDWFVKANTIVVGRVGQYCGNIHLTDSKSWVTDNAIVVRLDSDKVDPYYLSEALRRANLKRFASRSAQPRISQSVIETLPIPIPKKEYQQKISDILSTIDKEVEQDRETKQSLQELKRGLMQDLLTGKVRVPVDTDD